MISGIYVITNLLTDKKYIGSSINIPYRFRTHILALIKNKHHSHLLQKAFNEYGEKSFTFRILELVESANLLKREQWYLDKYNPEYNIAKETSASTKGLHWKLSEETRKRQSLAQKGKKLGERRSPATEFKKGIGFWTGKKRPNMMGKNNPRYGKHDAMRKRTGKIVKCGHCGKDIYKADWELKGSKSGVNFCSKHCSNFKRFN